MFECLIDSEAFTAMKKKYFAAYMFFVYEDRLSASLQCLHSFIPYIFSTDAIYGLFLPNRLPPVCHVVSSSSCQLSCELIRGLIQKSAIVSMAILLGVGRYVD